MIQLRYYTKFILATNLIRLHMHVFFSFRIDVIANLQNILRLKRVPKKKKKILRLKTISIIVEL